MPKNKSQLPLIFRLLSITAVFLLAPQTSAPAQNSERPVAQDSQASGANSSTPNANTLSAQQQQFGIPRAYKRQQQQQQQKQKQKQYRHGTHGRGVAGQPQRFRSLVITVPQQPQRGRTIVTTVPQQPQRGRTITTRPGEERRAPRVEVARPGECAICGRAGSCEIWLGSVYRSPVPFDGHGGFYIGLTYYWPQGCFQISRPYCHGITPDGCALSWQEVELVGGGTVAQCVQLCPRPGVAPPVAACPPCVSPAVVPGVCTVDIFAETNFAGDTDEFHENKPTLGDWDRDISSIQVKAGTWDFFTEPDYKGEVMRLNPGEYRELGAKWDNQIGSFMCVDQ